MPFFRNPQDPGFFFIEKLYRRGSSWSAVHTCHGKKGLKWDAGFFLLLFYLFFIFLSESHTHPSGKCFSSHGETIRKTNTLQSAFLFCLVAEIWKGIRHERGSNQFSRLNWKKNSLHNIFWQFSTSNRFPFLKWKFREKNMGSEIKFGLVFKMFYYYFFIFLFSIVFSSLSETFVLHMVSDAIYYRQSPIPLQICFQITKNLPRFSSMLVCFHRSKPGEK